MVCCNLTPIQAELYNHFIASNATRKLLKDGNKKSAQVLSAITSLKKLCNHPKLIYDSMRASGGGKETTGFEVSEAWRVAYAEPGCYCLIVALSAENVAVSHPHTQIKLLVLVPVKRM